MRCPPPKFKDSKIKTKRATGGRARSCFSTPPGSDSVTDSVSRLYVYVQLLFTLLYLVLLVTLCIVYQSVDLSLYSG